MPSRLAGPRHDSQRLAVSRPLLSLAAALLLSGCSSDVDREDLREHAEALRSVSAEAQLLLDVKAKGASVAFVRAHAEALADQASEVMVKLGHRPAERGLEEAQRASLAVAIDLTAALRPLTRGEAPAGAREALRSLEARSGKVVQGL